MIFCSPGTSPVSSTGGNTSDDDVDGDDKKELVLVGEWMPITILQWKGEKLEKIDNSTLLDSEGLWNTIKTHDIDNDGDWI